MMLADDRSSRVLNSVSPAFGSRCQMRKIILRDGISFIGLCLSITGLCALGYQSLCWLKSGSWPPLAFRLVLELMAAREPASASGGIEKIGVWLLGLPLSGFLIVSGLAIMTFGVAITAGAFPAGAADGEIASNFDNS